MKSKYGKQRLFEMMHTVSGMPLIEFDTTSDNDQNKRYENLINFIGEARGYSIYLHTTNTEENAISICKNGFKYEEFAKTVDYANDVVTLVYKLGLRNAYGNFTIIIQLNNNIRDVEAISKKDVDEEGEEIFILPPQYIKGYYNRTTKQVIPNPLFKQ